MRIPHPALLLALLVPLQARANAAAPSTYWVRVNGSTVTISPSTDGCPSGVLLRKAKAGGEVVSLGDGRPEGRWVDECVPPGTYQYGCSVPFECSQSGSDYYSEAVVEQALGDCTRTGPAPGAFDGTVPWQDEREICGSRYFPLFGCLCSSGGAAAAACAALALRLRRAARRRV